MKRSLTFPISKRRAVNNVVSVIPTPKLPREMLEQKTIFLEPNSSIEKITENLRLIRDNKIEHLLTERGLMSFLEEHFNTIAISPIKTEFLKRDLRQLLQEPLDLSYYSSLITQIRNSGQRDTIQHHHLFLNELLVHFSKYGFSKPF